MAGVSTPFVRSHVFVRKSVFTSAVISLPRTYRRSTPSGLRMASPSFRNLDLEYLNRRSMLEHEIGTLERFLEVIEEARIDALIRPEERIALQIA